MAETACAATRTPQTSCEAEGMAYSFEPGIQADVVVQAEGR
jgi:hypothetical protein